MDDVVEAQWVDGLPDADGGTQFFRVGKPLWYGKPHVQIVTRITVQHDLPGLHGNLRRVCVWIGDHLAVELPLHNVQAVGYPVQGDAA